MVKQRKRGKFENYSPKWNSNSLALRLQCLFPSTLQIGLPFNCFHHSSSKQNPTSSGCTVVEWQFLHAPVDTVHQGSAFLPRRPKEGSWPFAGCLAGNPFGRQTMSWIGVDLDSRHSNSRFEDLVMQGPGPNQGSGWIHWCNHIAGMCVAVPDCRYGWAKLLQFCPPHKCHRRSWLRSW